MEKDSLSLTLRANKNAETSESISSSGARGEVINQLSRSARLLYIHSAQVWKMRARVSCPPLPRHPRCRAECIIFANAGMRVYYGADYYRRYHARDYIYRVSSASSSARNMQSAREPFFIKIPGATVHCTRVWTKTKRLYINTLLACCRILPNRVREKKKLKTRKEHGVKLHRRRRGRRGSCVYIYIRALSPCEKGRES